MKHKIVFFDMDGTLYQTENDIIQDSTLSAIKSLKDAGYLVAAATGRSLNQMTQILERVKFDYYVLLNGGYILDSDFNIISNYPIAHQDVEDLVEYTNDENLGLMLHFGDSTYIYNDFYPMYYFSKYTNSIEGLFYDPNKAFHKRHDAYNLVVLTKNPDLVTEFIDKHPGLRMDLINVKTDGFAYDIFNSCNDKAHGIEEVLNSLGYTWDDAITFGDSTNDLKMLQKAGLGIAMGSAKDEVKAAADAETTDVYHHGIYNAIKKILSEEM